MKRVFLIIILALLASDATVTEAQTQLGADPTLPTTRIGTRGAAFLNLQVGARAQALGGAYTALASDVSSLYWNSAGMGEIEGFAAGFSQAYLYKDLNIKHTFVGAVLPVGLTRLGLSVNQLSSGTMPYETTNYPNSGYGQDTDPLRTEFEWTGMAVGLHIARPITDRLIFGAALKYITEGISGAEASYVGGDLGTIFRTGLYGITLGASLQNIGTNGHFSGTLLERKFNTGNSENQIADFTQNIEVNDNTSDLDLPTTFRFSIMANLIGDATAMVAPNPDQSVSVVWDINDAIDSDLQTALGVEYGFRDFAFLRAGKRWYNEAQISHGFAHGASFGGGLKIPVGDLGRLILDYAYTDLGSDLQNVQVFDVEIRF